LPLATSRSSGEGFEDIFELVNLSDDPEERSRLEYDLMFMCGFTHEKVISIESSYGLTRGSPYGQKTHLSKRSQDYCEREDTTPPESGGGTGNLW
jgi:hypothetical protein